MRGLIVLGIVVATTGCNTYRDQLVRAQHTFENNEHERTLTLLRELERDVGRLGAPEQAEYAYLRGMTDYRIGYRSDARHWLSIAKTYEDTSPGMLPTDFKTRLTAALDELNGVVYEDGYTALAQSRKPGEDEPSAKAPPAPAAPTKK
ncbi:MAG: hypothetical protein JST00_35410 [Deltaproteobacteria bacterium]|nr:hypothetical protein [Deltaproteobacteria bacterium]